MKGYHLKFDFLKKLIYSKDLLGKKGGSLIDVK